MPLHRFSLIELIFLYNAPKINEGIPLLRSLKNKTFKSVKIIIIINISNDNKHAYVQAANKMCFI